MKEDKHFQHPPFKMAMKGFFFILPPRWEAVSYLLEDDKGLFSFSSERGAHGQFGWRKVNGTPDIERIIEEVHRREMQLEVMPKIRFTRHGKNGKVILAHTNPGERFYASVYNQKEKILNEWIFPAYSPNTTSEVMSMLESYTDNAPENDRVFYAMFGLELSLPEQFSLKKIEPFPAAVTLTFEREKYQTLIAHRWGMADVVMQKAAVSNFYHRFLFSRKTGIKSVEGRTIGGYNGAFISFRKRGKLGFDYVLGPWWHGEGSAFLVEQENRIYAFEHIAPRTWKTRENVKDVFRSKLAEKAK